LTTTQGGVPTPSTTSLSGSSITSRSPSAPNTDLLCSKFHIVDDGFDDGFYHHLVFYNNYNFFELEQCQHFNLLACVSDHESVVFEHHADSEYDDDLIDCFTEHISEYRCVSVSVHIPHFCNPCPRFPPFLFLPCVLVPISPFLFVPAHTASCNP